ncbi:uncharacterized protein LOC113517846 isoform X2 [Galleria mellonella]|uniref:Uncharacterized protein LOC113517846 isoform X2 n=1 Tax=Galleria mellonella TaxID=7137 RepID=A0A6J1WRY9_GALME|nr:uncharacterized protein LOC113517846 isoform X2 [Galleria mellonella]
MRELNANVTGKLNRRRAVPVIHLQGSHYDVGYDLGRIFASMIKNFIATYENLRDFEKEYKTDAGRDAYDRTLANMKNRYPFYLKEMQGVADGAKVPFYQLFLLQMDDIMGTINDNHVPRNDTGGCSSIGVNNPDAGILGHTEDAFSETLNHFYIMSAHITPTPDDRAEGAVEEQFMSLCYAGHMPGYTMGYNQHGLVFSINTLSPLVLKPGNTPRTFITRALLAAKSFSEAEDILRDEGLGIGNGFSVNMLWTDPQGGRQLYNIEVAPDLKGDRSLLNIHKYDKETLVHCNIYQRLNVTEVIGPIIDSSESRLEAIHKHQPPQSRRDVTDILSDTTGKSFQVFQEKPESIIQTIAAGIFDLEQKTWSIYIDKPNKSQPVAILPIRFNI